MANEEERGKVPAAEQEQLLDAREAAAALNRPDHNPEKLQVSTCMRGMEHLELQSREWRVTS